jgi:DnaJ-domain-containing protein 1
MSRDNDLYESIFPELVSAVRSEYSPSNIPFELLSSALGTYQDMFPYEDAKPIRQNHAFAAKLALSKHQRELTRAEASSSLQEKAAIQSAANSEFKDQVEALKREYNQAENSIRSANIAKARTAQNNALASLRPKTKAAAIEARAEIDRAQQELLDLGVLSEDLQRQIKEGQGIFLVRCYRIFDEPSWVYWIKSTDLKAQQIRSKALACIKSYTIAENAAALIKQATSDASHPLSVKAKQMQSWIHGMSETQALHNAAIEFATASLRHSEVERRLDDLLSIEGDDAITIADGVSRASKHYGTFFSGSNKYTLEAMQALWGAYHDPIINAAMNYWAFITSVASHSVSVSAVKEHANVLQISSSPTPQEVKTAYKQQMLLYHPDKVQHLGSEIRALAHSRTQQIIEAYAYFRNILGF